MIAISPTNSLQLNERMNLIDYSASLIPTENEGRIIVLKVHEVMN